MDLKTIALLPPNDPERIKVEQDICQTAEGREAWLSSLNEAEKLKVHLRMESATPTAVSRILNLPRRKSILRNTSFLAGTAAMLALGISFAWIYNQPPSSRIVAAMYDQNLIRKIEPLPQVQKIALLAMDNYRAKNQGHNLTTAEDIETLNTKLPEARQFTGYIPRLTPLQQLTGGKLVSLDSKPALLTQWVETLSDGKANKLTLQQFAATELGLSSNMNPVLVHVDQPDKAGQPACDILVWSHNNVAFILVSDSADGCARRALQALRDKMGTTFPITSTP